MTVTIKSVGEVALELASDFRDRRIAANFTQQDLAERSGVTLASLKRFERTGNISLKSLLLLALPLGCLSSFTTALKQDDLSGLTMADLFPSKQKRKRVRK
jgi:transcriptional regulator with XRE-family HTH domain